VNEKRGISPENGRAIVQVFGGSAESWLTQLAQYHLARVRADRIKVSTIV
jgi:plasmid maintenance system antidote protein VapI